MDDFDEIARALGIDSAWLLGFADARPRGPRLVGAAPLFQAPEPANVRPRDYKDGNPVTHIDVARGLARAKRPVTSLTAFRPRSA